MFINGVKARQVESFSYLGSVVTSDGKCDREIMKRIGMAKSVFYCLSNVLLNRRLNVEIRMRILHCYVWSVLLYGSEVWTISKKMQDLSLIHI